MSNFYDVEIDRTVGEEMIKHIVRVSYDGGLVLGEVKIIDDVETVTPFIIQPWKCLPDGSRQNFVDQEDAFNWFETSIKDTLF